MFLFHRLIRAVCLVMYFLSGVKASDHFWKLCSNTNKERIVVVFQHSSRWDTAWFLITHIAFNIKITAVCMYQYFNIPVLGPWLKHVGLIPVQPKKYGGSGGQTEQLVAILNDKTKYPDGFVMFIAPQAGIKWAEWTHGYYHIAKQTKAKIYLAGWDYLYGAPMTSADFIDLNREPQHTTESVDQILMQDMKYCNALYPNGINPPSLPYPGRCTTCVDWIQFSFIFLCTIYFAFSSNYLVVLGKLPLLIAYWKIGREFLQCMKKFQDSKLPTCLRLRFDPYCNQVFHAYYIDQFKKIIQWVLVYLVVEIGMIYGGYTGNSVTNVFKLLISLVAPILAAYRYASASFYPSYRLIVIVLHCSCLLLQLCGLSVV